MAKRLLQSCKLFKALVHCLMPGADIVLEPLDGISVKLIRDDDCCMLLPSIPKVSLRLLPCQLQLLLQPIPEDVDIWIAATRKGSIDPNNVTGLDAHHHLVPVTGGFELVGIEPPKWMLHWQSKIGSIDRDLASLACITSVSVGPKDLHRSSGKIERPTDGPDESVSDNRTSNHRQSAN